MPAHSDTRLHELAALRIYAEQVVQLGEHTERDLAENVLELIEEVERLRSTDKEAVTDQRSAACGRGTTLPAAPTKHRAQPENWKQKPDAEWTLTRHLLCLYCGRPVQRRGLLRRWAHVAGRSA